MIKTSYPTIILLLHLKNNTYKERFEHRDGTSGSWFLSG